MPFSSPPKAIGSYGLISGTTGNDRLYASGTQAAFGGDGSDLLWFDYRKYSNGYWLVPFLVGGAGNDLYYVYDKDVGLIADLDGGYDKIILETSLDDVVFAWVNDNHILGYDTIYDTTILFIDPFGRESQDNRIEKWEFHEGTYSASQLEKLANSGSGLLGYSSWQKLDDSGYLKFSIAGLSPSLVDYYIANAAYNSSIVGEEITEDPSKSYNLSLSSKASDIVSNWFQAPTSSVQQTDTSDTNLNITANTWSDTIEITRIVQASSGNGDLIQAMQNPAAYDRSVDGKNGSILNGGDGADTLRGLGGWDIFDGGKGNDLVHGGNGRDIIDGGYGADELHGDFGWNTYKDERDGSKDLIAIKSDQHLSNWWYGQSGNSPNGEKADFIEGLDTYDEIKIIGAMTADLTFADGVTARGATGIGIYAEGTLEAVYTGGDLSVSQIQSMTTGDGSAVAMNNEVWSYWGDNTPPAVLA